jgi:hypothetical protein
MGSKKFRNKPCIYCGGMSSSAEHILPRAFFFDEERPYLPKEPACKGCNGAKSELDAYASVMFPLCGNTTSERTNRRIDMLASRLDKAPRKTLEAVFGARPALIKRNGILQVGRKVDFQIERVRELISYIARGLAFHHWGLLYPFPEFMDIFYTLPGAMPLGIGVIGTSDNGSKVARNFGEGTVFYNGGLIDREAKKFWFTINFFEGVSFAPELPDKNVVLSGWAASSFAVGLPSENDQASA